MNRGVAYLKLVRWPNLVIIAITMYLIRWFILYPFLKPWFDGGGFLISEGIFAVIVFCTMLVAAGGNIINDYFDIRIDRINKPQRIIVGKYVRRRSAMAMHFVMHGTALLLIAYLSWVIGEWLLLVLFFTAVGMLWFYSTTFKHMVFLGNMVIGFLASLVPFIAGFFEWKKWFVKMGYTQELAVLLFYISGYVLFAFLLTMAREITKDVSDMKGDKQYGSKTIPIVWGVVVAKVITGLK